MPNSEQFIELLNKRCLFCMEAIYLTIWFDFQFGVLQATRDLFNVIALVPDRNIRVSYDQVSEVIAMEISTLFLEERVEPRD